MTSTTIPHEMPSEMDTSPAQQIPTEKGDTLNYPIDMSHSHSGDEKEGLLDDRDPEKGSDLEEVEVKDANDASRDGRGKKCSRRRWLLGLLKGFILVGAVVWISRLSNLLGLGIDLLHAPCNPHPRSLILSSSTSPINGRYPLYDHLSLTTTTGDIEVGIIPQPADPENPDEPARLSIRSGSGSVTVSFAAPDVASLPEVEDEEGEREGNEKRVLNKNGCSSRGFFRLSHACKGSRDNEATPSPTSIPLRPYEIDITTETGSISGRFLVSSSLNLYTGSGTINSILVPVITETQNQNVSISTRSDGGSQQIHLTEPYTTSSLLSASESFEISVSKATHTSNGGSLQIAYPPQWAGNVSASSRGAVSVQGEDLAVSKDEKGVVHGFKAKGGSDGGWWGRMDVDLVSEGAVVFYVNG